MGARAKIDGETVFLGNRRLMETQRLGLGDLEAEAERLQGAGRTVVHVARAGRVIGLIAIADAPRPTAKATVTKLRERGVQVAMLTGDNLGTAERIAKDLGLEVVPADVLSGQKAGKVKELQAQGKKVGMVGDGVNDAPALAALPPYFLGTVEEKMSAFIYAFKLNSQAQREPPADAKEFDGVPNKLARYFSPNPGQGDAMNGQGDDPGPTKAQPMNTEHPSHGQDP